MWDLQAHLGNLVIVASLELMDSQEKMEILELREIQEHQVNQGQLGYQDHLQSFHQDTLIQRAQPHIW